MEVAAGKSASWPAAVAVSGGGDSLALLLLLTQWARERSQPAPVMLTVDHGLRPHSAREAESVVARARNWHVEGHILTWRGHKSRSNIEGAARDARYRLMGNWCHANGIACLYVAHTIDDQAETVLLRLARGSGVDGLSAMAELSAYPSPGCETLRVARPLLSVTRARLRAFLESQGESWLEDEMNRDARFARARVRAAWPMLESLGLTTQRLAGTARHLARARAALEQDAEALLVRGSRFERRHALADAGALVAAPEEIGLRVIARLLMRVSGHAHRPRFERLERLYAKIRDNSLGRGVTLHGCCIRPAAKREALFGPRTLRISREPGRKPAGGRE